MSSNEISRAPADEVYHTGDSRELDLGGFCFGPVPHELAHEGIKKCWRSHKKGRLYDVERDCGFSKRNQEECMHGDTAHVNDDYKQEPWAALVSQGQSAPDLLFPFTSPNEQTSHTVNLKFKYHKASFADFVATAPRTGLKIDVPASFFQKALEETKLSVFEPGNHVLPQELSLSSAIVKGLQTPVSVEIHTNTVDKLTKAWSPGAVIASSGNPGSALVLAPDASGRCLSDDPKPIYRADGRAVCTPVFTRLMPIDTRALEREINSLAVASNPGIVEVIPPGEEAQWADNVLQWLSITNYNQLLATAKATRPQAVEEIERNGYLYTNRNGARRLAVPRDSLLKAVRDIETIVDANNNLMNLSSGMSLVVYPEHPNGWQGAAKAADLGTHEVQLSFVVRFKFLPNQHHKRLSYLSM